MTWQFSTGHFLSCCLKNHFHKNKKRGQQGGGGGTVCTHWNSNDLTKKVSPKLYKNVINQNSTISHIRFLLYVLSPPESTELLKYPLLLSTLMYVYLIFPSFFLKDFRIRVLIRDLSRPCGLKCKVLKNQTSGLIWHI